MWIGVIIGLRFLFFWVVLVRFADYVGRTAPLGLADRCATWGVNRASLRSLVPLDRANRATFKGYRATLLLARYRATLDFTAPARLRLDHVVKN